MKNKPRKFHVVWTVVPGEIRTRVSVYSATVFRALETVETQLDYIKRLDFNER